MNRFTVFKFFHYQHRLLISIVCAVILACFINWKNSESWATFFLIGWNAFCLIYFILALQMMWGVEEERIQQRVRYLPDNGPVFVVLVILSLLASMSAIVIEISYLKMIGQNKNIYYLILPGLTILTSWVFTHLMFATHYAHHYYRSINQNIHTGIIFPGDERPNYGDFLYAAFIIGTSSQTADVSFSSKETRRIALIQSVLAFFFNTTIIALTVNIASNFI
jgi:uncharacterized membrane protein